MSDRFLEGLAVGVCVGFLVVAFFLAGFHHEVAYRVRQRRYGGWL